MKNNGKNLLFVIGFLLVGLSCSLLPQDVQPTSVPIATEVLPTKAPADGIQEPVFGTANLTDLYRKVNPSVVSIRTLRESEEGLNQGGLGTGFIWDEEGHVVTNFHVVRNASDLEVDFPSGFKTRARVIGSDSDSDLAVLELEDRPQGLFPLPLGSSRDLKVGQVVVAIGNPRGLEGTMTYGIVSAVGRTMESLHEAPGGGVFSTGNIIQTDAAINPGNSGGPLLNLEGEVVGINSAIQTNSIDLTGQPVNSGLGFAISIDQAKNVVPDLITEGAHDSPYVGISVLSEITLFLQEELNLPQSTGVYVREVVDGSPADKAGLIGALDGDDDLEGGDLIIAIDDEPVKNFEDFMGYLLAYKNPGDTIKLTVLRGEEELTLDLTLGSRPN